MSTVMRMTQLNDKDTTDIKFPYLINISSLLDYHPLVDYFEDILRSKYFAQNCRNIYFPEFIFSPTTAKIIYISNEINALTNSVYRKFDKDILELIISKYIDLFTQAEIYMNNEASHPVKMDSMVIELHKKSYDCSFLCSRFDYIEKDNTLFNVMYKFCSKSY